MIHRSQLHHRSLATFLKRLVEALVAIVLLLFLFVHIQPWMQDVFGLTDQTRQWMVGVIAFPLIWIGLFGLPTYTDVSNAWRILFSRPKREEVTPDIEVDGQELVMRHTGTHLRWDEIMLIELMWSENPWGDPWAGPYCDTDWLVKSNQTCLSIYDSPENRTQLLRALKTHLPDFEFNYSEFDKNHADRICDFEGGRILVWQRTASE